MDNLGAIDLRKANGFENLLNNGRRLLGGVAPGISHRLNTQAVNKLHTAIHIPINVEVAVMDLQRAIIKELKASGVDLKTTPNVGDTESLRRLAVDYTEKVTRALTSESVKPAVENFGKNFRTFIDKRGLNSESEKTQILSAIRDIKSPELIIVNTFFGELILGGVLGVGGAAIKHWVFSPPAPPPPPPPPPPSSRR